MWLYYFISYLSPFYSPECLGLLDKTKEDPFPHQLRLFVATWKAMSGKTGGHNQGLWSVSEVCCGLEKDRWWLICHPELELESVKDNLKVNSQLGTCTVLEWWVIKAFCIKVAILPSCLNNEIPGWAIYKDFLRASTAEKNCGKLSLLKYYNYCPYSGKDNGFKLLSANISGDTNLSDCSSSLSVNDKNDPAYWNIRNNQ